MSTLFQYRRSTFRPQNGDSAPKQASLGKFISLRKRKPGVNNLEKPSLPSDLIHIILKGIWLDAVARTRGDAVHEFWQLRTISRAFREEVVRLRCREITLHPFIYSVKFQIDHNGSISPPRYMPILTFQFAFRERSDMIWQWISSLSNLEELEFHGDLLELVVPPINHLRRLVLCRKKGLVPRIAIHNIVPKLADFSSLQCLEVDGSIDCADDASVTLQVPPSVKTLSIGRRVVLPALKSDIMMKTVPIFCFSPHITSFSTHETVWLVVAELERVLEVLQSSLTDLSVLALHRLVLPALPALRSLTLEGKYYTTAEFSTLAPRSDCWRSLSVLNLTRICIKLPCRARESGGPIFITNSLTLRWCAIKVHLAIALLEVEQTKYCFAAFNAYSSPPYEGCSDLKVALWDKIRRQDAEWVEQKKTLLSRD
ncbi:hypothetical protein BT69DRAFT_631173 [Atractiella rhizophila]|nr:hypothetical protein BT69DRAFT_631173 [Atractiella rhizophila]